MSILRGSLQRKLSAILGMRVTFEQVNLSLLKGLLDVGGISIAGEEGKPPVLQIQRVQASISLLRAMKREFSVKSLTIARPVISLVQLPDGSFNIPRRLELHDVDDAPDAADATDPAGADEAEDTSADHAIAESLEGDDDGGWSLDVQKVLVVDGAVNFRSEYGPIAGLSISAGRVLAELKQVDGGYDGTLIAESIARADQPATLDPIQARGRLAGVTDLRRAADASLSASIDLAGMIQAKVESQALDSQRFQIEANGTINLPRLLAMLPLTAFAALTPLAGARGNLQLESVLEFAPDRGLRILSSSITSENVALPSLGRRGKGSRGSA